jgi:hypothetical protein
MADRLFVNAVESLLDCPGHAASLGLAALLQDSNSYISTKTGPSCAKGHTTAL